MSFHKLGSGCYTNTSSQGSHHLAEAITGGRNSTTWNGPISVSACGLSHERRSNMPAIDPGQGSKLAVSSVRSMNQVARLSSGPSHHGAPVECRNLRLPQNLSRNPRGCSIFSQGRHTPFLLMRLFVCRICNTSETVIQCARRRTVSVNSSQVNCNCVRSEGKTAISEKGHRHHYTKDDYVLIRLLSR